MKRHISTLLLIMVSLGAYAQFSQGTKMVGGNAGFGFQTSKTKSGNATVTNSTTTYFSLEPQFGYFVIDRLAIGAGLEFSVNSYKAKEGPAEETSTTIQFAPFVRYYLPARIFFEGQVGIGTSKSNGTSGGGNDYDDKENISSWSLAAGYAIMLNESIAIEPMIGYGSTVYKDPDNDVKWAYPGLSVRVGFQIYLP